MRKIEIAKNLESCKSAVTALMLAGVLVFGLLVSRSEGGYELIWGEVGVSSESSGGGYTQEGSVLITDGNQMSGGGYTMTEESVVVSDDCIVGLSDFARFANHWLMDCDAVNNWCNGADLDQMDGVDWYDLGLFVDEWLHFCPSGWPLQ